MADQKFEKYCIFINIVRFPGCWIQTWKQNFKIQDGGSNKADQKLGNS